METISERIGLYDFWAVLLPGCVFNIIVIGELKLMVQANLSAPDPLKGHISSVFPSSVSDWIVFAVVSYLIGIILHEVGRWIKKIFKAKNGADGLTNASMKVFSEKELTALYPLYIRFGYCKEDFTVTDSRELFHRINMEAQKSDIAKSFVKLSVNQNMSYSLSAAFAIHCLFILALLVRLIINRSYQYICFTTVILMVFVFLSGLFFRRGERFNRYWVRNIVCAVSSLFSMRAFSTIQTETLQTEATQENKQNEQNNISS